LSAAADGTLGALLVAGVDPADLADPDGASAAIDAAGFVVSLELRPSAVTERADVVFPVAPTPEKSGTFLNWEGRHRTFPATLEHGAMPDLRVLGTLADELGVDLALPTAEVARAELLELGAWDGERAADPDVAAAEAPQPDQGEAVLTGWRLLLDCGQLQDGANHLAGTARMPVARLSADAASEIGSITLPLVVTDMPDRVVWLPLNSPGSAVHQELGVTVGSIVKIEPSR
jgi:NADH-quinone oxidoreductase subunit G